MPRRSILSAAEKQNLLALPDGKEELIRHYTVSDAYLSANCSTRPRTSISSSFRPAARRSMTRCGCTDALDKP